MDIFTQLAEEKIKQAIKNGEFDQLQGKGKPLKCEDLSHLPEDLRMSYRMMKNSGYLPEEVILQKELVSLRDMIKACQDDSEKERLEKRLSEKQLRFQMLMEKRQLTKSHMYKKYQHKLNRLF
ncbi:DnaJ family domain-containing protein [Gracilibacillus xinjiangensis]|uniref:DnaJ family domain-containing protein n=1 Tax=Gracilibacillus xinjiangensis TaxID=1193282 RepID=A0ABV8WT77_9BACI